MKRCTIGLLVLCLSLWAGFAAAQSPEKEKAAVTSAEVWLASIDSGNYEKSWKDGAGFFKKSVTEEHWVQSLTAVRKPLGKVLSREVKNTYLTTSLPGAPEGEYIVTRFETSFENKKAAIETATLMFEKNDGWRVSGYTIK